MQEMRGMLEQSIRSTLDEFDRIEERLTRVEVTIKKRVEEEGECIEAGYGAGYNNNTAVSANSSAKRLEFKMFPSFRELFMRAFVESPKTPRSPTIEDEKQKQNSEQKIINQ